MRRAVIFDMDGVITDTEKYYVEAQLTHLKECGQSVTADDLKDMYGSRQTYIWERLIERYHLGGSIEEHVDRVHELRDELVRTQGLHPMPGVIALIRMLKEAEVPLAVASSSPLETITHNMEALGIRDCFDALVTGLECRMGKPDPEIFLLAAKRLGAAPQECVVIEDSGNGVKAAKAAGMYCHVYVPPQACPQDITAADETHESYLGLSVEEILRNDRSDERAGD